MQTKKRIEWIKKSNRDILSSIIEIQEEIKKLHPLNPAEKVKLENTIAIDQLYYSSCLEGFYLTETALENVINGKRI